MGRGMCSQGGKGLTLERPSLSLLKDKDLRKWAGLQTSGKNITNDHPTAPAAVRLILLIGTVLEYLLPIVQVYGLGFTCTGTEYRVPCCCPTPRVPVRSVVLPLHDSMIRLAIRISVPYTVHRTPYLPLWSSLQVGVSLNSQH